MSERVVIIGAGQGGVTVAETLRSKGFEGSITLVGEEASLPYQRPPLSKAYLAGEVSADALGFRSSEFFADRQIQLMAGRQARKIDRDSRRVILDDGTELEYDDLVLSTGVVPRTLALPGSDLRGVHALATLPSADTLRESLASAGSVVIIGGGFIGLEVASFTSSRGIRTTVLEAGIRVMSRAVSPTMSSYFHELHSAAGVDIRLGAAATRFEGASGHVSAVHTAAGDRIPADVVIMAVGCVPRTELASSAGLTVENGIRVNEMLVTDDPSISAIGDCALFPYRDARIRLESVQNAVDHARCVASRLAGAPEPYRAVPWFWTEQQGKKLQIAGLVSGPDITSVTRGAREDGKFAVYSFGNEGLVGSETVGRVAEHIATRKLLAARVDLSADDLRDPSFDPVKAASEATAARV